MLLSRHLIRRSFSKIVAINRNSENKDKLLPLLQIGKPKEITIYIKGFLARGEKAEDFHTWRECHLRLCESYRHQWQPHAFAYSWQNQSFKSHFDHIWSIIPGKSQDRDPSPYRLPITIPVPVVTIGATAASIIYKVVRGGRLLTPLGFAIAATQDVALIAAQFASQYYRASKNAEEHAPFLTEHIRLLRYDYPSLYIRVVAHSLGCKLALKSIDQTDNVINELHLLAPAVTEHDMELVMKHHKGQLPVEKTFIYYSNKDYVLEGFSVLEQAGAVGYSGLTHDYPYKGIVQYDVTDYLEGFNKHRSYSWTFDRFAKSF